MPDQLTEQLQRISGKLRKAVEGHSARLKKIENLEKENNALKEREKELLIEIRQLKEQVFLLKASAEPLNPDDKREFEKMINEYLGAIDKCIAKLKR